MSWLFFLTTTFSLHLSAQGIEFFKGSWNDALELAKEQDKVIFVDGYAVWCGPCKVLSKKIFPQAKVGEYFNANFLNVKMDMEKGDGLKFRKKYPLTAFPTLYFIKPNGELIHAAKGAPRSGDALISLAEMALSKYDVSVDYMKKYEAGDRDYETMYMLVKSLNNVGKPSLKYTNEYLRTQDDFKNKENLAFIFEGLTQLDSRVYDLFAQHQSEISKMYPGEEINDRLDKAGWTTVHHAIEYEYPELLQEAQSKYAQLRPDSEKTFRIRSSLVYAIETGDYSATESNMNAGIKSDLLTEKDCIDAIHSVLRTQTDNSKALKKANKWCAHLIKKHENIPNYLLLTEVQLASGDDKAAIGTLDLCISLSKKAGKSADKYIEYQEKIRTK